VKTSSINKTTRVARSDAGPGSLLPALVAVGGGIAALPAAALELGDVKVNSSLGQPLRASIAYALGANEAISGTCVSLAAATQGGGLPSITRGSVNVANGTITITSQAVVREPLLSMRINVRCPYTPRLSRDYMLFVDPAQPVTSVATLTPVAAPQPVAAAVAPAPAVVRRRSVNREPIANATRYRVQPGDSLSQIAERIENRPVGLWDAVGAIFDANPDAFIANDPNQLKAGSWLAIPDFGAGEPLTVADNRVFPGASEDPAAGSATASSSSYEPATLEPAQVTPEPEPVAEPIEVPSDAASGLADLEPGDIILDNDNSFATSGETVVIPDTVLEGPETTSASPNVPTATIQPAEPESSSSNWFVWLVGAGLAIIVALLFGRGLRSRFGSTPVGAVAVPQRRRTDTDSHRMPPVDEHIEVEEITPVYESVETIDDDSPTEENLALDADLAIGTGLSKGTDVDLAQDFGFAATTDLDLELPEEMSSGIYEEPATDVIAPLNTEMQSILESEVLPNTDDEYDMSVIVDATKMPHPDDVTQRDLEAIEVPEISDTMMSDDYTVSQEVDYEILEQDYEDEMTATQVLNQEIARAAEELATRMDDLDVDDETSEMSLASVTALDVTAQLQANNDDDGSDLDDTGINDAITTVNMDADEKTVELVGDEKTVEMPADDNTVEMPSKKAGKR